MLTANELIRLETSLATCYSIPMIDDVEDFVWEAVWAYVMKLPEPDPLRRTKLLFDVVDRTKRVGWSAKTLVWPFASSSQCEFVIQRADVFKKAADLGYPGLTISSPTSDIGAAILEHWRRKVERDAVAQEVNDRRLVLLLKDQARRNFVVIEEPLNVPDDAEIQWQWTNASRIGLQGFSSASGILKYRWYSNQKQLFESIPIPTNVEIVTIEPLGLTLEQVITQLGLL